jgi:uncharacterized protein YciI
MADVIGASKGMLQKRLYAISTVAVNGLGPILAIIEQHLDYQRQLEADGILFAAGPIFTEDETEWLGEGLVIVRAASRAEAVAIAERDPMHASGARTFTVRPWMINEGGVSVRLDFSTQRFTID